MRNPHEMTAAEKLLRIKELCASVRSCADAANNLDTPVEHRDNAYDAAIAANTELEAILASVTSPPLHLMTEWRAPIWAQAFAAQFPSVRADDALAWFANAINAGTRTAYEEGDAAGYARAAQDSAAVMKQLADTLETVKDGVAAGVIRCNSQLTNLETGKARPLGEYVAEALQLVGR